MAANQYNGWQQSTISSTQNPRKTAHFTDSCSEPDILRASEGVGLAVTDEEIPGSILDRARNEGIFLSPEGASVTAAYDKLPANGTLQASDRVALFITGAGLKLHGCNR